jgi:hypothetical protein
MTQPKTWHNTTPREEAENLLISEFELSSDYIKNNIKRKMLIKVNKILSNENLYPDCWLHYNSVRIEIEKL